MIKKNADFHLLPKHIPVRPAKCSYQILVTFQVERLYDLASQYGYGSPLRFVVRHLSFKN